MASTAVGSDPQSSTQPSSSTGQRTEPERQPQAGPLPAKVPRLVGEIGYAREEENESTEEPEAAEVDTHNDRHPADRSYVDLNSSQVQPSPQQPIPNNESASSLNTLKPDKCKSIWHRKYGGVTLKAISRFAVLLFLLMGCIVGWVFAGLRIGKSKAASGSVNPIFLHMIFAILVIVQVVFLERALFRIRAERYAHVHPGQILPSHRNGVPRNRTDSEGIAFVPWNRPSLPTYAAALGFRGTGDVEDAIIAAPPPPAYGNTRGSTLILANLLRNSLVGSRRSRQSSRSSWHHVELDRRTSTRSGPIPYDESEMTEDARRAQRLAETLTQLEDGSRARNG